MTGRPHFGGGKAGAFVGRGRRKPGSMNKLETRYASLLEISRLNATIIWWGFEAWKFRLADGAFYTPDFDVLLADGSLEAHEVKGHWEEAARVRIKVAAELHPLRFIAVTERRRADGGGWDREVFE